MTETSLSDNLSPELLNELVGAAAGALGDGKLSFGEVVSLGGVLAGKANQIAHLSGAQKKALVLQVVDLALKKLIDAAPEKDKEALSEKVNAAGNFAKEVLPSVLDLAVSAARGKLDLRKPDVRKSCISSITALFHVCRASVGQAKKVEVPVALATVLTPTAVVQEEVVAQVEISPSVVSDETPPETQTAAADAAPEESAEPKAETAQSSNTVSE